MNKRSNKWFQFDLDSSTSKPRETVTNGNKYEDERKTGKSNTYVDLLPIPFNLFEELKPTDVDDLAVHTKKVKEVSLWLEHHVCGDKKDRGILLLTGPTGVGKTATVNALCHSLNITVREWINPVDQPMEGVYTQAHYAGFMEFFDLSKYYSLKNEEVIKQVLIVEDFPNFLVHKPEQFVDVLKMCSQDCSVIFICTDASNGKIDFLQMLFPQDVREKYYITTINFNPLSATLIKNALKRAQQILRTYCEDFKTPTGDVMDAIVVSAMGDVRSAVNQFTFACLKGIGNIPVEHNETKPKKRKRGEKLSAIKSMERDEILGFFHGLGRVLNPKHCENESKKLEYDFDSLIDQFATQPNNFNSFLHENYVKYFGDLSDACKAADILSTAQVFLNNWGERHEIMLYALWISVLGLMIYNEHKVSRWNQIKGPTKLKRKDNSAQIGDLNRVDCSYYNLITKTNKFHTFKS